MDTFKSISRWAEAQKERIEGDTRDLTVREQQSVIEKKRDARLVMLACDVLQERVANGEISDAQSLHENCHRLAISAIEAIDPLCHSVWDVREMYLRIRRRLSWNKTTGIKYVTKPDGEEVFCVAGSEEANFPEASPIVIIPESVL